mgnify:CR=1 FL=1
MACIGQNDMGPGGGMGGIKIDSKKRTQEKNKAGHLLVVSVVA